MMRHLCIATLLALTLAGCSADPPPERSATLSTGDVLPDGSQSRTVSCAGRATVSIDVQGTVEAGSLTVKVREGNGVPVYEHRVHSGASDDQQSTLDGGSGSWNLIVDRSLEFEAPATITLAC